MSFVLLFHVLCSGESVTGKWRNKPAPTPSFQGIAAKLKTADLPRLIRVAAGRRLGEYLFVHSTGTAPGGRFGVIGGVPVGRSSFIWLTGRYDSVGSYQ
jgi:hypothetical protein